MNLRSQTRAFVIRAATLFRADELTLRRLANRSHSRGLVVGVHETPAALEPQFREQLEWVSRYFTTTNLEGFARLWDRRPGENATSRPPILFTFDDGRLS